MGSGHPRIYMKATWAIGKVIFGLKSISPQHQLVLPSSFVSLFVLVVKIAFSK